jgi:hypothetical protein
VKSNSRSDKQFCYQQISPDTRNKRKGNTTLQHDDSMFGPRRPQKTYAHYKMNQSCRRTRHVTGALVATCKKLHRHSRHYRASSTAVPVPRLEVTLRMTQQCQPGTSVTGQSATGEGTTVDTARNGLVLMAMAGGRKQRSSRQPSSRPLLGQRENPLSRREDGVPVFCSSNVSRAQRLPREPLVPSH